MMKLKILKWEMTLDGLGGPPDVTAALIVKVGGRRVRVREGDVTMEAGKSNAFAGSGDGCGQ